MPPSANPLRGTPSAKSGPLSFFLRPLVRRNFYFEVVIKTRNGTGRVQRRSLGLLRNEPHEGLHLFAPRNPIEAALAQSRGRISGPTGAANKLGIGRQALDRKNLKFRHRQESIQDALDSRRVSTLLQPGGAREPGAAWPCATGFAGAATLASDPLIGFLARIRAIAQIRTKSAAPIPSHT
jgi:hypothetical protein